MNGESGLPTLVDLLADVLGGGKISAALRSAESLIFALLAGGLVLLFFRLALRRAGPVPGRLQAAAELLCEGLDDFVTGIMGPRGKKFVPFISTLFVYVLVMNLMGLIPFLKSGTASPSTTIALSLCVFVCVQFTAFKELGPLRYADHLAGKPRGAILYSILLPIMVFATHFLSELIRPLTLSMRLFGNIWGDDTVVSLISGFGILWTPLVLFTMLLAVLTAVVQALVFATLTTIYFSLIMPEEEEAA
jgi:F-type H+-transporting ATPase subunit a